MEDNRTKKLENEIEKLRISTIEQLVKKSSSVLIKVEEVKLTKEKRAPCTICFFGGKYDSCANECVHKFACLAHYREDKKSVYFKRIKTE